MSGMTVASIQRPAADPTRHGFGHVARLTIAHHPCLA